MIECVDIQTDYRIGRRWTLQTDRVKINERDHARDMAMIDMLASGFSRKQIAWELKINKSSVALYVVRLRQEMNAKTDAELVAQAIRMGLIQ